MDEAWRSSEISLEIFVHASARDTNAEDAIYRQQGSALLNYMNHRLQQPITLEEKPLAPAAILQTPAAPEILVPETRSSPKSRAIQKNGTFLAVAESILVSAECSKDVPSDSMIVQRAESTSNRGTPNYVSLTASTASMPGERNAPQSLQKARVRRTGKTSEDSTLDSVYKDPTTPTAAISAEHVVSPDSAKLVLQTPRGYQTRKLEFEKAAEAARTVNAQSALTEVSPNKRRRLNTPSDLAEDPKKISTTSSDMLRTRRQHDGWPSSIAQLTSSSSVESMPRMLISAETRLFDSDDAFLAPFPSSGNEPYTSHLVGTLALVAESQRLCAAYRPKEVKRKIEPLERGYWHLRIPYSWSSTDQEGFWDMLEEMIVEGKCGWGNWVEHVTEPLSRNVPVRNAGDSHQEPAQKHVSEIKVWCWGEVVREIWLSLLMASRRQTLRLGMAWYDSVGERVIQMR